MVIATDYFVDEEQLDALDEVFKPVVGDLDGNGKVSINYAVLYVGNTEVGGRTRSGCISICPRRTWACIS